MRWNEESIKSEFRGSFFSPSRARSRKQWEIDTEREREDAKRGVGRWVGGAMAKDEREAKDEECEVEKRRAEEGGKQGWRSTSDVRRPAPPAILYERLDSSKEAKGLLLVLGRKCSVDETASFRADDRAVDELMRDKRRVDWLLDDLALDVRLLSLGVRNLEKAAVVSTQGQT